MQCYKVYLRSVPGFFAQYAGFVRVYAHDEAQAVDRAFHELKRGAFPDRNRSMWKVERVELAAASRPRSELNTIVQEAGDDD